MSIEPRQVTRANNPLGQLGAVLEAGESIIIFPEGGRSSGPQLGPFKSGLFHLAKRHPEAELITVSIDNLNRVLPKGEFLPVPLLDQKSYLARRNPPGSEAGVSRRL